jgi:predicted TIM-barrel fold metal-dependent hydrolase
MQKVIDLGIGFPADASDIAATVKALISRKDRTGIANYIHIFGPRWASALGIDFDEVEQKFDDLSDAELDAFLEEAAGKATTTPDEFRAEMDEAGIEWGLLVENDNDKTAERISRMSGRLKGMAYANPLDEVEAVRELERAVRDLGFIAVYVSPFDFGIKADDARFFPIYSRALELQIPVFVYTSMNYRTDLPMDVARPLYLDRVAMAFPKLHIVAECGGWPWVPEMIGVARRHQNVYINTSSHRPKYLAVPGSGWEMLLQFGNTLLQDRIVFASGMEELGLPIGQIVEEVKALPLKETVKQKWLYTNALRLFGME